MSGLIGQQKAAGFFLHVLYGFEHCGLNGLKRTLTFVIIMFDLYSPRTHIKGLNCE